VSGGGGVASAVPVALSRASVVSVAALLCGSGTGTVSDGLPGTAAGAELVSGMVTGNSGASVEGVVGGADCGASAGTVAGAVPVAGLSGVASVAVRVSGTVV